MGNLPVEVILSVDFLMDHDIFSKHQHTLVHSHFEPYSELDISDVFGIYRLPHGSTELENLADLYVSDREYLSLVFHYRSERHWTAVLDSPRALNIPSLTQTSPLFSAHR